MTEESKPTEQGEILPIEFGGKVIAAKRRCTCGGDVVFEPNPEGQGQIARCTRCNAHLPFGGS